MSQSREGRRCPDHRTTRAFEWVKSRMCGFFLDSKVHTSAETGQPNTQIEGETAMEMVNSFTRRFGATALRMFGILALALLLTTSIASHAGAEPNNGPAMDKGAFKTGCEAGGGSYIDNPDGSFQCNLRGGGVIKCTSTTTPCTYTALKISVKGSVVVNRAGALQVVKAATATPASVRANAVNQFNVTSATAP
jgi:hypothetical protein